MSRTDKLRDRIENMPLNEYIMLVEFMDIMQKNRRPPEEERRRRQEAFDYLEKHIKKADLPEDFDWKKDKLARLEEKYGRVD
jgi:hypothetical protein